MATKPKMPRCTVTTPEGVAAFVHLLRPKEPQRKGAQPKYEITLVFSEDTDTDALEEAILELAEDAFGDKARKLIAQGKMHTPFKVCAEHTNQEGEPMSSYGGAFAEEGARAISASSLEQPGIIDEDGNDLISAKHVYSGMVARASLNLVAFDTDGNRGVSCFVQAVQRTGEGEPYEGSGPVDPRAAFGIKGKAKPAPKGRRDANDGADADEDDAPPPRRALGRRK